MDPKSTNAAIIAAQERQSRLFDDLRKRNERRGHGARLIVPEIADQPAARPPEFRGEPVVPTPDTDAGAPLPTPNASTPA